MAAVLRNVTMTQVSAVMQIIMKEKAVFLYAFKKVHVNVYTS